MLTATPPQPPPRKRGRWARHLALAAAVVVVFGCTATQRPRGTPVRSPEATPTTAPVPASPPPARQRSGGALPLRGVPLAGPTGLRLLVADVPAPFVLDLDQGTVQPITGLPTDGDRGVTVVPVGEDVLVGSYRFCDDCRPDLTAYLVRRGGTAATRLGRFLEVVASRDGQGVWLRGSRDASHCTIREVGLDGRPRRAALPVRCQTELVAELPAGLLVSSTTNDGSDSYSALLRPDGSFVRLRDPQARPVVGDLVLSGGDRRVPLVLDDVGSGASYRLSWPSRLDAAGLGEVTGDPNGQLAVVEFANAAEQTLDLWLLDTATRRWRHLPDMPAPISPKAAHVQWTPDGRVVLLASTTVAVWRPGDPRLAVRQVKPPNQPDRRFVIW